MSLFVKAVLKERIQNKLNDGQFLFKQQNAVQAVFIPTMNFTLLQMFSS